MLEQTALDKDAFWVQLQNSPKTLKPIFVAITVPESDSSRHSLLNGPDKTNFFGGNEKIAFPLTDSEVRNMRQQPSVPGPFLPPNVYELCVITLCDWPSVSSSVEQRDKSHWLPWVFFRFKNVCAP